MSTPTLPTNLRPPVKVGDCIERLCRLEGGGWFFGPRVAVKYISSGGVVYVRYKHGKRDKIADEYRIAPKQKAAP